MIEEVTTRRMSRRSRSERNRRRERYLYSDNDNKDDETESDFVDETTTDHTYNNNSFQNSRKEVLY